MKKQRRFQRYAVSVSVAVFGAAMLARVVLNYETGAGWLNSPEIRGILTATAIFSVLVGLVFGLSEVRARNLAARYPDALIVQNALHAEGASGALSELGAIPSSTGKFSNPLTLVVERRYLHIVTGMFIACQEALTVSNDRVKSINVQRGKLDFRGSGSCLVITIQGRGNTVELWAQPQSRRWLGLRSLSTLQLETLRDDMLQRLHGGVE